MGVSWPEMALKPWRFTNALRSLGVPVGSSTPRTVNSSLWTWPSSASAPPWIMRKVLPTSQPLARATSLPTTASHWLFIQPVDLNLETVPSPRRA